MGLFSRFPYQNNFVLDWVNVKRYEVQKGCGGRKEGGPAKRRRIAAKLAKGNNHMGWW